MKCLRCSKARDCCISCGFCNKCIKEIGHGFKIKKTFIGGKGSKPLVSLEDALAKVREVRAQKYGKGATQFCGRILVPRVLVGHKIRIVLADDEEFK